MPKRLTGGTGTGDKILKNWNLFSYEFDMSKYEEDSKLNEGRLYPYKVRFGNQTGYFNIVVENNSISQSTVIDCRFPRPLGAYNDRSLYEVAKKLLRESGVKTDI